MSRMSDALARVSMPWSKRSSGAYLNMVCDVANIKQLRP